VAGFSRHPSNKNGGLKPPLQIAADGDLVVKTDGGEVRFHKPVVYQPVTNGGQRTTDYGQRTPVDGHYILEASNRVQFQVAPYDHSKALFIDPVLSYSTYLGGSGGDSGTGIAVDSSGNAYVTGSTSSTDFPTVNPFQATNNARYGTAFVTKFNAAGSALVYSTYLGGSNGASGNGIAVDSSGNAYVTGQTSSTDFPTVNPFQATNNTDGGLTAFVTKFNAAGSALVYSTYLGGSWWDNGTGIAVDSSGSAYVTGSTNSADFPTVNPFQANWGGAFVTKFNAAGSALVYSTYLGGSDTTYGTGIALDSSGDAYVTGGTNSPNFPTVNPFQATRNGGYWWTAFVAKLNAAGSALVYSTYLGGGWWDNGTGIAVDSSGNAYVTGQTNSPGFPLMHPIQGYCGSGCGINESGSAAFVTEFNAAGSALVYSTFLGGISSWNGGNGIAVDSSGNAYVTG